MITGKLRRLGCLVGLAFVSACSTVPLPEVDKYELPDRDVYLDEPRRAFKPMKVVRIKESYISLNPKYDEKFLCQNAYNKAVGQLLKRAKNQGADAVVNVRSVVFLLNGEHEIHRSAECADDGAEGQILVQGVAVKWQRPKRK